MAASPVNPAFISEWPCTERTKIFLREKRWLWLAVVGMSIAIWPFPIASALSKLRGRVPGLAVPPSGDALADSVGCMTLAVGLMVTLLALVSLQRLRRAAGSKRYTALYLRPVDDAASRRSLENALYNLVGSRIRLLQLADKKSNLTSQSGVAARLVVSSVGATFLILTLELCGLVPKLPDGMDSTLVMLAVPIVEISYRQLKTIKAKGAIGTLEELEAEVRRARSWMQGENILRKPVLTFATSDAIWTDAVRQLAPLADVVLLDVSRPGKGLAWELSYCLDTKPDRLLVLGREADIRAWLRASSPEMEPAASMKELLAGRQILVYDRVPKTFPQALLAALLEIGAGGDAQSKPTSPGLRS
jgi:hypothetical protein